MSLFSGPLGPLLGAAGTALLNRTYLLQNQSSDFVPRILIVMDTVNNEEPEFTADVTQHAVEQGSEVSDHIQLKNPTLTLKGKISNTPLDLNVSVGNLLAGGIASITSSQARSNLLNTGLQQAAGIAGASLLAGNAGGAASALTGGQGLAGAADALARTALLNAYENKTPFDVITKRQRYESMVIQRLKFPRDASTGYALYFELEMIKLRTVSAFFVQLTQLSEDIISSATPSTNLGAQTTQQVSAQTSASSHNNSILRSLFNLAKGGA